jgi:nanoRNase/pAp phosphatase (c-di-AMP/oligoRNAs hydrolase)
VRERVELYFEQQQAFDAQLARVAKVHGNLVVLDLRDEEVIHAGNRFMIYAQFPECDLSMHVMWGRERMNTVYTVGKSIFGTRSEVEVGELMLRYGGGGHSAAGTCQGPNETAEVLKQTLIQQLVGLSRQRAAA